MKGEDEIQMYIEGMEKEKGGNGKSKAMVNVRI